MSNEKSKLAQVQLKDGSAVDLYEEAGGIVACHAGNCLGLPGATGQQAMELLAFLESLGGPATFPEEEQHADH